MERLTVSLNRAFNYIYTYVLVNWQYASIFITVEHLCRMCWSVINCIICE